jgi:hypothetical protein
MLSLSVEEEEHCAISDFEAPYIKVEFECSHSLSIMAFANIVNIRASDDTESIVCPYCRASLIPKLVDSPAFQKITIPEIPNLEGLNKDRVKTLKSSKSREMMSEENMSCVSGLFQGLSIPEVRERHDRRELFRERYELLSPGFASNRVTPLPPVTILRREAPPTQPETVQRLTSPHTRYVHGSQQPQVQEEWVEAVSEEE